ncbi:LPXTG cell wall anchor domain-containing protein [Kitasatospora sp. NPDC057500]
MPDTGAPVAGLIAAGGLLVAAGGVLVHRARRRAAAGPADATDATR